MIGAVVDTEGATYIPTRSATFRVIGPTGASSSLSATGERWTWTLWKQSPLLDACGPANKSKTLGWCTSAWGCNERWPTLNATAQRPAMHQSFNGEGRRAYGKCSQRAERKTWRTI